MMQANTAPAGAPGRIEYFDYLRVLAALGVVMIHISATNWDVAPIGSPTWLVFTFYSSTVTWPLPIFVMISGALFLRRDHSIQSLLFKNILRVAAAFLFWSALYAGVAVVAGGGMSKKDLLITFMRGHYHLWFLFLIAGLYLVVPLLRRIVTSAEMTRYFLLLALLFTFVLPELATLLSDLPDPFAARLGQCAAGLLDNASIQMTAGYVAYFVLGYYLSTTDIKPRLRRISYALGLLGLLATFLLIWADSVQKQAPYGKYGNAFTVNVLLISVAVFLFAKYHLPAPGAPGRLGGLMRGLSNCSFGIYLIHPLVIEQLNPRLGLDTLAFPALLSVPLIVLFVFAVSAAVSALLHQIPFIRDYFV